MSPPDASPAGADARRPGWLLLRLFRLPRWLYRTRLGWLLGNRFLLLTHRGRRSGRTYQTVLEVARYDRDRAEWTVVSGYGTSSDWYRNLVAEPAVRIQVGRRSFTPLQRVLDPAEAHEMLADYQRRHPRAARMLGERLIGQPFDGTPASGRRLAERLPAIAFRQPGG